MNAVVLLESLSAKGVSVVLADGGIEFDAPEAVYDDAAAALKAHKADIVAFLACRADGDRRPARRCGCGFPLTWTCETPDRVETILSDGVTLGAGGGASCPACTAETDDRLRFDPRQEPTASDRVAALNKLTAWMHSPTVKRALIDLTALRFAGGRNRAVDQVERIPRGLAWSYAVDLFLDRENKARDVVAFVAAVEECL